MLILKGVENSKFPLIREISEYVPLRIEASSAAHSADDLFYWRATNRRYLIELKLQASNGIFLGADVVLVPGKQVRGVGAVHAIASAYTVRDEGIPLFDVMPWLQRIGAKETLSSLSLRRIDEEVEFELIVAPDGVGFMFFGCKPTKRVTHDGVSFVFSDTDELCGILIEGVSKQEHEWLLGFKS